MSLSPTIFCHNDVITVNVSQVTDKAQSFQNIMRCYRFQPQAQSHVYRSVLLTSRNRHTSGSSDGSRAGASRNSSPVNGEKDDSKEKSLYTLIFYTPVQGAKIFFYQLNL